MVKYILKRILFILFTLFVIVSLLYFLCEFYTLANYTKLPIKDIFKIISKEYIEYMKGIIFNWDWGKSSQKNDVWDLIMQKAPTSIKINVIAFILYVTIGITLGIISAIKKNTIIDNLINIFIMVFGSLYSLILIFILMLLFGYYLKWLPTIYPSRSSDLLYQNLGLIIPIIALMLEPLANLTRLVRGELIETLDSDFILLARCKGLTKSHIIIRHGLRNSMVPIMPTLSSSFVIVLFSSFFVEYVYAITGIARWFMESFTGNFMGGFIVSIDTNSIVGICAFYSFISLFLTLIVDIIYRFIDPRMNIVNNKTY